MIRMSFFVLGMVGSVTAGIAAGAGCASEEGTGGAGGGGGDTSSSTTASQSGSGSVGSSTGGGGTGQGGAGAGTGGKGQGGSVSSGEGGAGGGGGAPGECTTAADCRLFSSACGSCECIPLAKSEPDPTCNEPMVNCLIDPCQGKKPACSSSGGQCIVQ
jgi:hypothetical protein